MEVEEARKILGRKAEGLTDEYIQELVSLLEVIAKEAIKQSVERIKLEEKELVEWASFLYTRYLASTLAR